MKHSHALVGAMVAAIGLALLPASAAVAAENDVVTDGWRWLDVSDNGYELQDVESYYESFLDSGSQLEGWRDDAFDDLMRITKFDPDAGEFGEFVPTYPFVIFGADELGPLPITTSSATWLNNDRTTTVGTAIADFGDGRVVTLTFTLEVENSTVRYTVDREVAGGDPADVEVVIGGDLGSDSDSTYVDLGAGAWISHDTNRGDPVIAWRFTGLTPSMGLPSQHGGVEFSMTGAGESTITVAVIDFDECSFDDAIATMTAAAPTLALGQSIAPLYATDCLTAVDPAAVGPGAAIDAVLPLTPAAALDADNWVPSSLIDFTDGGWRVDVVSAPAGLLAALEWVDVGDGALSLRLSGTPTESWSGPAVFVVHNGDEPVLVEIDLEIAGPPELAATGPVEASGSAAIAALLLVIGAALVLGARRRGAATR